MFWKKRIAPVSARMMTWEVTTSFDGTLTGTELQKRFYEDFGDLFGVRNEECGETCNMGMRANRVFFWPLVSFNASDGRKHRFLVAIANEPLMRFRKKFDRCLPRQIVLYAVADKLLRGEMLNAVFVGDVVECGSRNKVNERAAESLAVESDVEENVADDGNLLLVALWKNILYILVFMKGRLCHWSEELGYGDCFDERIAERVQRFKEFLKADELFASAGAFGEAFVCGDNVPNTKILFQIGAKDSFWRDLDLDESESMKPCEKRRWTVCALMLLTLGLSFALFSDDSWVMRNVRELCGDAVPAKEVAPVELSLPAERDLEKLAWAEGHRDLLPAKWTQGRDGFAEGSFGMRRSRWACDSLDCKLLGIVGGRVALMKTAAGETKTLSVGDSLLKYRVKEIGKNEIVLRCGRKEVRYEIESPNVSSMAAPNVLHVGAR